MVEVRLKVEGVWRETASESQVVILRDEDSDHILPIWIGLAEGDAIHNQLKGVPMPRPQTHDLLHSLTRHLKLKVQKIVITEIRDNTYYATVYIQNRAEFVAIDARPSDAIALALRSQCAIYAAPEVLKKRTEQSMDEWLARLEPRDFEKYDA